MNKAYIQIHRISASTIHQDKSEAKKISTAHSMDESNLREPYSTTGQCSFIRDDRESIQSTSIQRNPDGSKELTIHNKLTSDLHIPQFMGGIRYKTA